MVGAGWGDDRSVKIKSLEVAKIIENKMARSQLVGWLVGWSAVSESESEVVWFSKRKKT